MADDDGGDWFGGGDDDVPPLPVLGKKAAEESAPEGTAETPDGEAPAAAEAGEAAEEKREEAEEEYLDPDKLILFKHWIRPKFLPYKYLYLYRRNYYDDVMDYLDKRSRGIPREIPRAQVWAERILRTYSDKVTQYRMYTKRIREDLEFVDKTSTSGRPKFLPYKCLYDYRLNYYDDVLEALASRRRGVRRDIPRAQTWGERMVRLTSDPIYKLDKFDRFLDDLRFVTKTEISGSFYVSSSKEQFNRRFSRLLF